MERRKEGMKEVSKIRELHVPTKTAKISKYISVCKSVCVCMHLRMKRNEE
jgi:hypothetical protein